MILAEKVRVPKLGHPLLTLYKWVALPCTHHYVSLTSATGRRSRKMQHLSVGTTLVKKKRQNAREKLPTDRETKTEVKWSIISEMWNKIGEINSDLGFFVYNSVLMLMVNDLNINYKSYWLESAVVCSKSSYLRINK